MEFLMEYGLFLAKTVTLLGAFIILAVVIVGLIQRQKESEGDLVITNLTEQYKDFCYALESEILDKAEFKALRKAEKKQAKQSKSSETEKKSHLFVLDFKGDIQASEVESLRHAITAILTVAKPTDEVLVRLESAGGVVHGYGLAASQLMRFRQKNIRLTVAVDRVAASGGYMMACVADHIVVAPFAILGSIGVLGQVPNFNRLLKKLSIDVEEITAGEYKRTLSMMGENTEHGRAKFAAELAETHELFKNHVSGYRPQLDIAQVATGEFWYGLRALELKLADEIATSDDFLLKASERATIFLVEYTVKQSWLERMGFSARLFKDLVSRYF